MSFGTFCALGCVLACVDCRPAEPGSRLEGLAHSNDVVLDIDLGRSSSYSVILGTRPI